MDIGCIIKQYMYSFRNDIHWDIRVYNASEFENNKCDLSRARYFELLGNKKYWYADPILIDHDGRTYLFFEQYDIKARKGTIGYSEVTNEGLTEPKCIIRSAFHMSFPMVFEQQGQYYMIPETEADQSLLLYRAEHFPDKWVLEKRLLTGVKATDTILIREDDNAYLLVSEDRNSDSCDMVNVLYPFDLNTLTIVGSGVEVASGNVGVRNAGKPFCFEGKKIRPGQDCKGNVYGRGICFWEYSMQPAYLEKMIDYEIHPLELFGQNTCYTGTHTFSVSQQYVAVDCRRDVVNPAIYTFFLTARCLLQRIMRKLR